MTNAADKDHISKAPRQFLRALFAAAVDAAQPEKVLPAYLPETPKGRTLVIGAGKASAQMGAVLDAHWAGEIEGLIVTQYGAGVPCARLEVVEANHPVPDAAGHDAAKRMLAMVSDLTEDDLVIALISGGGSSLLPLPIAGLTLADEQAINEALLASGAPIGEMNVVRKMFSQIKGGRLAAAAAPAKMVSLILSDVPGDDASMVASGPTVADERGRLDAEAIIEKYGLRLPKAAIAALAQAESQPPKPDDQRLKNAEHHIIASAGLSLAAAKRLAEAQGIHVQLLGDDIEGEAREVGHAHAKLCVELLAQDEQRMQLVLSGGETSVTFRSQAEANAQTKPKGKGGRNTEYLLGLITALEDAGADLQRVHFMAADTDGRDGSEQNAGAFADAGTLARLLAAGGNAKELLEQHFAFSAFELAGDLFNTGPTGTNVNDFRAMLILPRAR